MYPASAAGMFLEERPPMPEPVDILVGQKIRSLRIERDISQSELATGIGVTFQQVQKYEKGTNRVSASRLVQIANILGADVRIFFDGVQSPASINDNFQPKILMIRQGHALSKAFHAITDPKMRTRLLGLVQSIAAREANVEIDEDPQVD
jgi:transcriptional regulator with XRE-family HTH domain